MAISAETKILMEAHAATPHPVQTQGQKGGKQTRKQTGVVKAPPLLGPRPPGMPGMMPPGSFTLTGGGGGGGGEDPPDFGEDLLAADAEDGIDTDYEKVEFQGDLNAAMDDVQTDEDQEEDEDEEDVHTEPTVSPASAARAEERVLDILTPSLVAIRGNEAPRTRDASRMREESINKTEGVTLITITVVEKNYGKMGRMIGSIHRMEGIKLLAQLSVDGQADATDLILEISNSMVGKLIQKTMMVDMQKAIEPKLRTRSTEGLKVRIEGDDASKTVLQTASAQTAPKPAEVNIGSTGGAASGSAQILTHSTVRRRSEDTITHCITSGDEESLLKLLMTWAKDKLREKISDFMEYKQTGVDS